MTSQAKRFEIVILRPLQIVFLISAVAFLFQCMWWWLGGCFLGLLYLGIVGSKLHPLQSATDLAKGPLDGPAAQIESELIPAEPKKMLVGHACTRVGILLGVTTGVVVSLAVGWSWYLALPIALVTMLSTGALLKMAFRTVSYEA